jgi:MSHA biogenesis protein MshO
VRTATNGGDSFIEFIPVKAAGRYRAEIGNSTSDNPLDFSLAADTFDVLGSPINISTGDKLVIYNLGIAGADAYEGTNISTLQTTGTLSTLSFNGTTQFPLASPSSRFYVVSTPVTYACDMTNHVLLQYSGYVIQPAQAASIAALNGLAAARQLANNLSFCQINYTAGALQRSGIVTIYLGFSQDVANVKLMQQVNVVNSP